jgi:hypothetical protein
VIPEGLPRSGDVHERPVRAQHAGRTPQDLCRPARAKPEGFTLLAQVLQPGELPRGDVDRVTGLGERTARALLGILVNDGILGSDTPKGPVSLRFPLDAIEILFPSLFPQT